MAQRHDDISSARSGPLSGYRVLELGHYIAAPFATRLLADMGADVIKIEAADGDPVRDWGEQVNGHPVWWSVHGRNKRCITLNLKAPEARTILADLARGADAIIENFRAGHLARLGFSDQFFQSCNPDIVVCHISGFGQTGPKAQAACFGVIGEAIGGLRYLSNHPKGVSDLPPVRAGVSIGDSVAGLYAALGVTAALASRGTDAPKVIDVALTEAVLSLLEGTVPEYGKTGKVREPAGGRIPTASPSNAFPTRDGRWAIIAANSDQLFARLCTLMGQPELAQDPRYQGNPERCRNVDALEAEISAWTRQLNADVLERLLEQADIPSCRVYAAPDIVADEQFRARDMILTVEDPALGPVLHPAPVPMFQGMARDIAWTGPAVGQHNADVYHDILNFSAEEVAGLRSRGVI